MIEQPGHNYEWFQATITLGNFASEEQAQQAIQDLSTHDAFIAGEVKGSWH